MFVCWAGGDSIVELGVWCDLFKDPSIGCKSLREFFMIPMGYAKNSCGSDDCKGVVLCEMLSLM